MNKPYTSNQINSIFTLKGCVTVTVAYSEIHFPESGRLVDEGDIFVYAPGLNPDSVDGFNFTYSDIRVEDQLEDGVIRFDIWLVTPGELVPATGEEYKRVAFSGKRMRFGRNWVPELYRYFIHRDEKLKLANPLERAYNILGVR